MFLRSISNFIIYWVFIEFLILIFMGIIYTILLNSFSSLMLYFIIQALSSFLLLSAYLFSSSLLITLSILLKLSIFPFHSWFIRVSYRFPTFILWLISTLHKIPIFIILIIFHLSLNTLILWSSFCLSCIISGLLILSLVDLRIILIVSSIGNNSWFFLSSIINQFTFLLFIFFYSLTLFLIFINLSNFSKFNSSRSITTRFLIVSLSGLPPFPIFFSKILILLQLLLTLNFRFYLLLFLIRASTILIGYIYSISKFFISSYRIKIDLLL